MHRAEGKGGEDDEKDEAPFDYSVIDCVGDGFVFHLLTAHSLRSFEPQRTWSSVWLFPVSVIVLVVILVVVTLFLEVHIVQDCS